MIFKPFRRDRSVRTTEVGKRETKSKAGPSGPRTAAGKVKSKLNASTHQIFLQGILPKEEEIASILFGGFRRDLALKGITELEIGDGLVRSSLVERRIRKYEAREFNLVPIVSLTGLEDRRALRKSEGFSSPTGADREASQSDHDIMRMFVRLSELNSLMNKVAKHGPDPISDGEILNAVYRNCPSVSEQLVRIAYATLKESIEEHKDDEKAIAAECVKRKKQIVNGLGLVINELAVRLKYETMRDKFECEAALVALPPDSVLDRIEWYRCANDRRIRRLLQNLETVRRLRSSGRLQNTIIEC